MMNYKWKNLGPSQTQSGPEAVLGELARRQGPVEAPLPVVPRSVPGAVDLKQRRIVELQR